MLETIIIAGVSATIGCAVGGAITAKVVASVTKAELMALSNRVDKHEEAFHKVLYRDVFDAYRLKDNERQQEILRRIDILEKAFRDCFDDLVHALQNNKGHH